MNTKFYFTIFAILALLGCKAQTMIDKSNWDLIINEEFNTNITDLKTRWHTSPNQLWQYGSDIFQSTLFKESNISMSNGILRLKQKNFYNNPIFQTRPDGKIDTARSDGAWISYKLPVDCQEDSNAFGFKYGIFEVRCRVPKTIHTAWVNPSFWLQGGGGEIDVFEIPGDSIERNEIMCSTYKNYTGGPICVNYFRKKTSRSLSSDFHTYTVAWTPNEITFFFDGKELETRTNLDYYLTNHLSCKWGRMNLILYINKPYPGEIETQKDVHTDSFEIDYIKVYKRKSTNTNWSYRKYYQNLSNSMSYDKINNLVFPIAHNIKKSKIVATTNNIFYVGTDAKLHNYYKSGSSWQWGTCSNVNDVSEDLTLSGNRVFYRSTNNSLKYFEWNGSSWLNYNSPVVGTCMGFINVDDQGKVFYKGLDNNMYVWSPGWTSAIKITNDGSVRGGLVVAKCGCLAFWRDQNNNLRQAYWWNQWNFLGVVVNSGKVTDNIVYDENFNIYFSGNDNFVYRYKADYSISTGNTVALSSSLDDKNCAGELALSNDNKLLFYKGNDNRLWYYFNDIDPNNNLGTWYASPSKWSNTNVDGPISVDKQNGIVYYKNTTNNLSEVKTSNGIINLGYCGRDQDTMNNRNPNSMYKTDEIFESTQNDSKLDSSQFDISIYPNPFTSEIYILNKNIQVIKEVSIFDLTGRKVFGKNINKEDTKDNEKFIINSNIANGTYSIVIYDEHRNVLKKQLITKH